MHAPVAARLGRQDAQQDPGIETRWGQGCLCSLVIIKASSPTGRAKGFVVCD
jgi:hypothetical protein